MSLTFLVDILFFTHRHRFIAQLISEREEESEREREKEKMRKILLFFSRRRRREDS